MPPRILTVDPRTPDLGAVTEAARVLAAGGLVAFPTETVYGLGARGLRPEEVAKIFAAKGRPPGHPVILHVDGIAMARTLAAEWPDRAERLAEAHWPGPLTLVVRRAERVPPAVTGGMDTVGVRAPAHPVALALIAAAGEPLAAPSANAHMHVSPTTAQHVVESLGDRVDLVLDAGLCAHGIESTVVAVDGGRVLRPGALSVAQLRATDPAIADYLPVTVEGEGPRAAPGMAKKHYAPRARVVVAEDAAGAVAAALAAGGRVAWIAYGTTDAGTAAGSPQARVFALPDDEAGYARALYATFYAADAWGAETIVIRAVPASWTAVADRIRRAATR